MADPKGGGDLFAGLHVSGEVTPKTTNVTTPKGTKTIDLSPKDPSKPLPTVPNLTTTAASAEPVYSAPVTDKLLGFFGFGSSPATEETKTEDPKKGPKKGPVEASTDATKKAHAAQTVTTADPKSAPTTNPKQAGPRSDKDTKQEVTKCTVKPAEAAPTSEQMAGSERATETAKHEPEKLEGKKATGESKKPAVEKPALVAKSAVDKKPVEGSKSATPPTNAGKDGESKKPAVVKADAKSAEKPEKPAQKTSEKASVQDSKPSSAKVETTCTRPSPAQLDTKEAKRVAKPDPKEVPMAEGTNEGVKQPAAVKPGDTVSAKSAETKPSKQAEPAKGAKAEAVTPKKKPAPAKTADATPSTEATPAKADDKPEPSTQVTPVKTDTKQVASKPDPAKPSDETKVQTPAGSKDDPLMGKVAKKAPPPELEEAFQAESTPGSKKATGLTTPKKLPQQAPRGIGVVHPDTPIPNSDVALRLLRRFAKKTRPNIPNTYGGSKGRSIIGYLFSTPKEEPRFVPFKNLMDVLFDGNEPDEQEESERVVDSIMGQDGDTMSKARLAVASFCHLMSVWGHFSSHVTDDKDARTMQEFTDLLCVGLNTAGALVAHGCMDGVLIGMGNVEPNYSRAVHILAESVFVVDLTIERVELTVMKFLLTTGCHVTTTGEALIRGTHLLQAIRLLYHVFLTTIYEANKTTARASLQQLVTSVFNRMIRSSPEDGPARGTDPSFPSENHRDAFLVLRSMCKLSMRSLPDPNMHSHVGLQSSGSNTAWDGKDKGTLGKESERAESKAAEEPPMDHPHLIYTSAIHPALESKALAMELLLYVLENTDMSGAFVQQSGPQFHYAIRNYLCVSLLKNCTSDNTKVVNLSLRMFVPIIRNFRSLLKTEIEAFVTNVFFVILDSKNSPVEHKSLVVTLFEEICSDPATLAEIFLNYDCDLSAVDLFHRIVNTLSRVARSEGEDGSRSSSSMSLIAGAGAARMEKVRGEHRELRLQAMRALRQILASLHASIVEPMPLSIASQSNTTTVDEKAPTTPTKDVVTGESAEDEGSKQTLVQIYDSKKKRREEESEVVLRFNQKPSAGIAYAAKCGHVNNESPADVARYLLKNKDLFDKTQIGEYLGREAEYQEGFSLKVLHEYVKLMDFKGLVFDDAIRFYLSGFRLPGEAQKIDRIMEKFAERYTSQNPDVFPSADVAFILAFSTIMLNTDLHNPAIKEERRMTKEGFIRNNRGISDGQDLPEALLTSIFDRIKENPISLKEDDEARERAGETPAGGSVVASLPSALSPAVFFSSHYDDLDRTRETNFQKERDHIVRTTESLLKRRRHGHSSDLGKQQSKVRKGHTSRSHQVRFVRTHDSGMRDEYVSPMFEVAWGPVLAAFSTAMESANGTVGALIAIATDEELELAAENAAETIEVCLTGFRFAICTAGLCGNDTARDAYMLALSRFSQLGTGVLLEPRHIRCIQTMLELARDDGELLGSTWEHVFVALSEVNRFHQLFHLMARNDRAAAAAAERRRNRLEEREKRRQAREARRVAAEAGDSLDEGDDIETESDTESEDDLFSDDEDYLYDEEMDKRAIDEANARAVYEAVSETLIEAIYQRSSSLSGPSVMEFISRLCHVSRLEISGHGSYAGGDGSDLTHVNYRQQHSLLSNSTNGQTDQFHHSQPNIYNLQKLVEVAHYNMESRPRLVFTDIWTTVAEHLTNTALHGNPAVAIYAVDSFRQLSIQYLQREELGVFEFQRRFLKPFETVMSRSQHVSVKELLLKCIDRIIFMFGSDNGKEDATTTSSRQQGHLRSGWRPVLTVLGLAGRDENEGIATLGFQMLTKQLQQCLSSAEGDSRHSSSDVLLGERFIDLVDALLMYVAGPHDELSLLAVDHVAKLSGFLGDGKQSLPKLKRRHSGPGGRSSTADGGHENNASLELWWPILLGLSRSVGDTRESVRSKGLSTLLGIVNRHFFPPSSEKNDSSSDIVQTLQLIFRGILMPVLDEAETDSSSEFGSVPALPDDFERFLAPRVAETEATESDSKGWLDTTFDTFMDGCIFICIRSVKTFADDTLVEEILSMLNTCLVSDSGGLAVRGLKRLERFITNDLPFENITDDTWATVSHMLRRCLSLKGLPGRRPSFSSMNGEDGTVGDRPEDAEALDEFVSEDNFLVDRRYVASNAVKVVSNLLTNESYAKSLGLRWYLFLVAGLGRGIRDWEQAYVLLSQHKAKASDRVARAPHHIENAMYGRKWMIFFLIKLVGMHDLFDPSSNDDDSKRSRATSAQNLVNDQTKSLVSALLENEAATSRLFGGDAVETALHPRLNSLASELLKGFAELSDSQLRCIMWLKPALSTCSQSKDEAIRTHAESLSRRMSPPKKEEGDSANVASSAEITETPDKGLSDKKETQGSGPNAGPSLKTEPAAKGIDAESTTGQSTDRKVSSKKAETPTPGKVANVDPVRSTAKATETPAANNAGEVGISKAGSTTSKSTDVHPTKVQAADRVGDKAVVPADRNTAAGKASRRDQAETESKRARENERASRKVESKDGKEKDKGPKAQHPFSKEEIAIEDGEESKANEEKIATNIAANRAAGIVAKNTEDSRSPAGDSLVQTGKQNDREDKGKQPKTQHRFKKKENANKDVETKEETKANEDHRATNIAAKAAAGTVAKSADNSRSPVGEKVARIPAGKHDDRNKGKGTNAQRPNSKKESENENSAAKEEAKASEETAATKIVAKSVVGTVAKSTEGGRRGTHEGNQERDSRQEIYAEKSASDAKPRTVEAIDQSKKSEAKQRVRTEVHQKDSVKPMAKTEGVAPKSTSVPKSDSNLDDKQTARDADALKEGKTSVAVSDGKTEKPELPVTPLPEGWLEGYDPKTGRPYYYNERTKVASWKRPTLGASAKNEPRKRDDRPREGTI